MSFFSIATIEIKIALKCLLHIIHIHSRIIRLNGTLFNVSMVHLLVSEY